MKRTALLAFAGTVLIGVVSADIVNPSFEDTTNFAANGGDVNGGCLSNCQDTMSLAAGSTLMPGWTVTGYRVSWIGPANPFNLTAEDGSYFLDLTDYDTHPTGNGVTQSVATTVGATYDLTFYLGSSAQYGFPVGITAGAGGSTKTFTDNGNYSAPGGHWTQETFQFTASAASTQISLTGAEGTSYIGLDNVQLITVTPEPVSSGLIAAGLASLAFLARARRRSN